MDMNGFSDPYVVMNFATRKLRTPIIKKSLHPVWNHQFRVLVQPTETKLAVEFEIWDWDKASADDHIATCVLELESYTQKAGKTLVTLPIPIQKLKLSAAKRKKIKEPSELKLEVHFSPKEELKKQFWAGLVEYFDVDGNNARM